MRVSVRFGFGAHHCKGQITMNPKSVRAKLGVGFGGAICFVALVPVTIGHSSGSMSVAEARLKQGPIPIKHVVIIVQETRSFDEYFGTFPGADVIPMQNGKPTIYCVDPHTGEKVY